MRVEPLEQDVLLGSHDEERRAEGEHDEAFEIDVGPIHDVEGAGLGADLVEDVTSCVLPSVMRINVGMLPCRSSSVASSSSLVPWNLAHGNSERHRSMVVSRA